MGPIRLETKKRKKKCSSTRKIEFRGIDVYNLTRLAIAYPPLIHFFFVLKKKKKKAKQSSLLILNFTKVFRFFTLERTT